MNCVCHGLPAYFQKDKRCGIAGGYWKCAVIHTQKARDRYDRDFVYRVGKNLHDNARRRAQTLKRRREQLGPLSLEG